MIAVARKNPMFFNLTSVTWNQPGSLNGEPSGGVLHIWKISLDRCRIKCLSAAEFARAEGIADPAVRGEYVAAQGGLRMILGIYVGQRPEELVFSRRALGKPFIEGAPEFNLTHSAGQILVAVSAAEVGIDVERLDRRVNARGLASKFFANEERKQMFLGDDEVSKQMFLNYWVCKESIVKLSGDGIYHGLRDAVVSAEADNLVGDYRGRRVWLERFSPADGVVAAAATWEPAAVKCFFEI